MSATSKLPWWRRPGYVAEMLRFGVVGVLNTTISYIVYLSLSGSIGYQPAYAIAYMAGIVVAYLLNSSFVFRSRMSMRTALQYPAIYLAQYLFGALMLYILVAGLGWNRQWAALLAIVLSIPVSFVLNRIVLVRRASP